MKIEVWPFLISRNWQLEYRTVAAPDFMVNAGIGNLLADAIYGEPTESGEAICRQIHNSKVGELTVVFQVVNPTAREVGIDENGLLMDRYYRPILFLEGIVLKREFSNIAIGKSVFTKVRDRLLEPFYDFWNSSEFPKPIALENFEVETEDNNETLIIREIKAYFVRPKSSDTTKATENVYPFADLEEEINQKKQEVRSLKAQVKSSQEAIITTNSKWNYVKYLLFDSEVTSVAFSPNKDILAVRTDNQKVSLWNWSTSNNICIFIAQKTYSSIPGSVTFSPDGKTIASSFIEFGSNIIKLWKWNQYANEKDNEISLSNKTQDIHPDQFPTITSEAVKVLFSPDGQFIICGSQDKSIQLWDAKTHTRYKDELSGIKSTTVSSFAISPNSCIIAGGCEDGEIVIWKIKTKAYVTSLTSHQDKVNAVTFSSDGQTLASGSSDNTIRLWDLSNEKEAQLICVLGQHSQPVNAIAFSPDSRILASSSDYNIKIWDISTKREIQTLCRHKNSVTSLAFNPNGQILASGSNDKTVIIWRLD